MPILFCEKNTGPGSSINIINSIITNTGNNATIKHTETIKSINLLNTNLYISFRELHNQCIVNNSNRIRIWIYIHILKIICIYDI